MTTQASALRLEEQDGIAILTFDLPGSRANTLSQAVLAEFEQIIAPLQQRTDLKGLILRSGKPGMFIAGADLNELAKVKPGPEAVRPLTQRGLDVIASFEKLPFPTIAAIDGACLGGGLELALGFDYRIASTNPKTELGCPEVKVGLIPGWGGTQRLSRLIGPALATELIATGETVKGNRARELGIVTDAVAVERLQEAALDQLRWTQQSGEWRTMRQRKQQPVGLSEEESSMIFAAARGQVMAKTKGQLPAPLASVDAIAKGCNQTLAEGLKVETEAFIPLAGSPISRNLIAVFFMTQRLQKDPGVADASIQPKPVNQVGVLGAGIMGAGIAGAHIRRGIPVMLLDVEPRFVEKGVASITKGLQGRIDAGRGTQQEMVDALSRLSTTTVLAAMADRDVVVEAVIENEEVKVKLYAELQKYLRPNAILASNTSTISITRMTKSIRKLPQQFAGMHFFNPVDRMQLVEVIRGEQTSDQTVVTLVALAKRVGKTPIVVRDCPGFLVNRILFMYLNESLLLLEEGASPRALDKAATTFGMPMGPVTLNDVVGLDTSLFAGRVINTAFADRAKSSQILDDLVAAGRLGQKSGAGFYSYPKGPRGVDDPALATFIERHHTVSREISQEEITDRLFLPMVTEATRILAEKVVRDPSDVDMGMILGTGFPTYRGGLLRWADQLGIPKLIEKLKQYEKLGLRFQPTPLLLEMAGKGRGFYPETTR
jgi:3-hydroxyacyl-CoA dehydrogenase/enoyl-CoA hydratase/3-hydroxybutyryl-CoA epimerase/3-hydroxyacyl-CoA dehydrogenase/enoyl-CoA hydratase/3-hydroxybutyryl-CoA epimerase/enoyl-CoA isomerase